MEITTETLAIASLILILIADKVLGALKARGVDLQKIASQINTLADQHNCTDADGVPVWYVRQSLEDAIKGLNGSITHQTEILISLVGEIKEMNRHRNV